MILASIIILIISLFREGMLGDYSCTASNKHGTSSARIQVVLSGFLTVVIMMAVVAILIIKLFNISMFL